MSKVKFIDLVGLFDNVRRKQVWLFIVCFTSIVVDILFVYQLQGLIDAIVAKSEIAVVFLVIYRILGLGALSFVLKLYQAKTWHNFRYYLINNMRVKMFSGLLNKSAEFFDKNTTGDLASKVLNDGSSIAESAGISILMILLNCSRVLIVLGVLCYFNFVLASLVLVFVIMYYLSLRSLNGKLRNSSREERVAFGDMQQAVVENIKGIREIKILKKESYINKKFHHLVNNIYNDKVKKLVHFRVVILAITSVMTVVLPTTILVLGTYFTYNDQMTIGTLILFYTLLNYLIEPVRNLSDAYQGTRTALGAADRLQDFLFEEGNKEEKSIDLPQFEKMSINISKYDWEDNTIFRDFTLELNKNDRVLISGDSGRGKSTLLHLVMNFYNLSSGEIRFNDIDTSQISKNDLYNKVLLLSQDAFIFEGTVKENLTMGDAYTLSELEEVIRVVCLEGFIEEYGFGHKLIEAGANISGGEKQRVALARVLLRKPEVLLLDEATSALDKFTEKAVIANLHDYLARYNMTLTVVSHNDAISEICNKKIHLA